MTYPKLFLFWNPSLSSLALKITRNLHFCNFPPSSSGIISFMDDRTDLNSEIRFWTHLIIKTFEVFKKCIGNQTSPLLLSNYQLPPSFPFLKLFEIIFTRISILNFLISGKTQIEIDKGPSIYNIRFFRVIFDLPPISDFPPILKAFLRRDSPIFENLTPSLKLDIIYGRPLSTVLCD